MIFGKNHRIAIKQCLKKRAKFWTILSKGITVLANSVLVMLVVTASAYSVQLGSMNGTTKKSSKIPGALENIVQTFWINVALLHVS